MVNLADNHAKYRMLGDEQAKLENFGVAIDYYKKCLEIYPDDYVMLNRIGHILPKAGYDEYLAEQVKYFEAALRLKPDYALTIRNLAFAYFDIGRLEDAFACFEKLIPMTELADDYVAYGCRKIKVGDFEKGWKYYEHRFNKVVDRIIYPEFNKPKWDGSVHLDKTLLIQNEQGFGDTIMFCRFVEQVKPKFNKVILRVQESLIDLLKNSISGVEIVSELNDMEESEFDFHISMMSLPYVLETKASEVPFGDGYLFSSKDKVDFYKEKYFNNDLIKIGISWKGMILGNKDRNIPIRVFKKLSKLNNVKIYIFQKDYNRNEMEQISSEIDVVNISDSFENFMDTSAAMANLDLFITTDNVLLNLAGARGVKTYALLNIHPEWRWCLDGNKTPWYNSVEVFKRADSDSWDDLMNRVVLACQNFIS